MKLIPWLLLVVLLAACYPSTQPTPTPLPGSMVITEPIRMELVRVPAGEFLMGSDPAKDPDAIESEQPQHRVALPEYYIGRYEVTNGQYGAFVNATGYVPWNMRRRKEDYPRGEVTWYDAVAFTEWLSEETDLAFRLCTEAEWEKACRGTDGFIYPWGDTFDEAKANTRETNKEPPAFLESEVERTKRGGTYSPAGDSPYGAADMAGNVDEWTSSLWGKEDTFGFSYPYDPNDGRENQSAPDDVDRVLRGGAYWYYAIDVRCAARSAHPPGSFHVGAMGVFIAVGFRVCVSPGASTPGQ